MSSTDRSLKNKLEALSRDLQDTKEALTYLGTVLEELTKAHNVLQGHLLATGVVNPKSFEKPPKISE